MKVICIKGMRYNDIVYYTTTYIQCTFISGSIYDCVEILEARMGSKTELWVTSISYYVYTENSNYHRLYFDKNEFNEHFMDLVKYRDDKINEILK